MRLRWTKPIGLFFILGALATVATAGPLTGSGRHVPSGAWDANLGFPNPLVSQLDNPRFTGGIPLLGSESVERAPGDGVFHNRIKLLFKSSCPGGDALCLAQDLASVHPVDEGKLEDGWYDFTAFGARIGHEWADLWFEKTTSSLVSGAACNKVDYAQSTVRVDRETIIVPVHVAVEIPAGDPNLAQLGGIDGVRKFQALFDDNFEDPGRTHSTTYPGPQCVGIHQTGPIQNPDLIVGEGTSRLAGHTVRLVDVATGKDIARPDDIFVQCGVQFRLASVTELRVQSPAIVHNTSVPSANTAVEGFRERIQGEEQPGDERILLYGDPSIKGVVAAFMQSVGGGGSTTWPSRGRAYGRVAGVAVAQMTERTLAHELGHVLGVTGSQDDQPHADCSAEDSDQLMCGGEDTYFMGGCDQWREGIERRKAIGTYLCPDVCEPFTIDLPVGCNPGEHPNAESVCRDIRAGAASYAMELSGNKPPQIELLDQDGNSLDDLPLGPDRGASSRQGRPKKVECGGDLYVRAVVLNDPADPFPELSYAMGKGSFTAGAAGWEVSYSPPFSADVTEVVTYPATQSEVTIDLERHPEDNIAISYAVYDIQGARGSSSDMREGRPQGGVVITERTDTEPPTIGALGPIRVEGCAGGEPQVVSFPTDSVEDNCGSVTLTGQAVALNGQPLLPPVPLDETSGALLTNPGDYTIEWTATDQAGNQVDALQTVTLDACMGAGSSLQIQNAVTLANPDGSPMSVMVLQAGTTHIGGQSHVGGVTSAAPVQIDGGAVVDGNAISGGSIQVQAGATVLGQVQPNQELLLPAVPAVSGVFPSQCGSAVQYNADAGQHELPPGCYSELRLGARTRLVLEDGVYAFHRVLIEPDAVLVTAGSAAFDVRDELSFRGRLELPAGGEGRLGLQYRGTQTVLVEAPYAGSVFAPEGTLVLGGNHGQVFRGRFYGKNVDVRAGLQVISTSGEPTGLGTLSYRAPTFASPSSSSTESQGCSASRGRAQGSWSGIVLFLLGGFVLGRRRARTC